MNIDIRIFVLRMDKNRKSNNDLAKSRFFLEKNKNLDQKS
jgi:hypothetical protein